MNIHIHVIGLTPGQELELLDKLHLAFPLIGLITLSCEVQCSHCMIELDDGEEEDIELIQQLFELSAELLARYKEQRTNK